jgi:hypothetical protein
VIRAREDERSKRARDTKKRTPDKKRGGGGLFIDPVREKEREGKKSGSERVTEGVS